MPIFEMLLTLFLWFALCSAYPKNQDDDGDGNALALFRERRGITDDLIGTFEKTAMGILSLPVESTETVSQLISNVVRYIVDWLVRVPFEGLFALAVRFLKLLSSVSPISFAYLPTSVDAVKDYVREGATNLLEQAIRFLWRFLSTTGLPWLRRILDQIVKLPYIPATARTMIQNFNTLYDIAQLMGFISPAY